MNVNTLHFKPVIAWNEGTIAIYQKIERGIERLQCKCDDTMPDLTNSSLTDSKNCLLDELDKMLRNVQTINADIKRLQILKVWLCAENVAVIGNLLKNNSYLSYEEQELENIVRLSCK